LVLLDDDATTSSSAMALAGGAYSNFIDTIKSDKTRKQYKRCLVKFMRFASITEVDNLLVLAGDPKALQQKIIDYVSYLKARRLSAVTISLYLAAVVHFYSMNDVTLNRRRIGRFIPQKIRYNRDRAYTREEISKLLEFCDLRNRAIVLLFASTGMRVGAVPGLNLEHLSKVEVYNLYQITVYAGYEEEYICFCTPEAAKAIDEYLSYRERAGEALIPGSPLFREQFDVSDLEQIRKKAKRITEDVIDRVLANKLTIYGIMPIEQLKEGEEGKGGKKRKAVMRTHGFRKFVDTTMINHKLNSTIRKMLLGQSTELDESYYRPQPDDLLQEYLIVVDARTINEENRLRRQVRELLVKTDKLDELEQKMARLDKMLGLE
jgi:integrase